MRKLILLLFIAICSLSSCAERIYSWGMTEQDFLKQNHDARFIQGDSQSSVYRREIYHIGMPVEYKFYYFTYGKLVKIDEGQPVPDITIKSN